MNDELIKSIKELIVQLDKDISDAETQVDFVRRIKANWEEQLKELQS